MRQQDRSNGDGDGRRSFGSRGGNRSGGNRGGFGRGGNRSGGNRGGFGRGGFGSGGRGNDGFNRSFGPREMHKAICSDCKQECEVPFKPTEGKPVYCRDCFSRHKKF